MDRGRLGLFFLLIGLIMLIVFFGTDQSRDPRYDLFVLGVLMTGGGAVISWRFRKKPEPANRFATIKKAMQPGKKKEKSKEKKKLFGIGKS